VIALVVKAFAVTVKWSVKASNQFLTWVISKSKLLERRKARRRKV